MADLYTDLIRLGSKKPELRNDLKPILDAVVAAKRVNGLPYWEGPNRSWRGGWVEAEIRRGTWLSAWVPPTDLWGMHGVDSLNSGKVPVQFDEDSPYRIVREEQVRPLAKQRNASVKTASGPASLIAEYLHDVLYIAAKEVVKKASRGANVQDDGVDTARRREGYHEASVVFYEEDPDTGNGFRVGFFTLYYDGARVVLLSDTKVVGKLKDDQGTKTLAKKVASIMISEMGY